MKLHQPEADIFIPGGADLETAMSRVTRLGVGAHQDDLEFMACHGIAACYEREDEWFGGIVCTDGRGSPRAGPYAACTDEEMRQMRRQEQRQAARTGRYALMLQLDYTSAAIKHPSFRPLLDDLKTVLQSAKPGVIYTHNPFDKHPTHLAVMSAVLQVLREMAPAWKPRALYGCEMWRGLDWLPDGEKIILDTSSHPELAETLFNSFQSQIQGGKNYGGAVQGRWRANATFTESHAADRLAAAACALDLLPLLEPESSLTHYTLEKLTRFQKHILSALNPYPD